jgi:hypothetical protein
MLGLQILVGILILLGVLFVIGCIVVMVIGVLGVKDAVKNPGKSSFHDW